MSAPNKSSHQSSTEDRSASDVWSDLGLETGFPLTSVTLKKGDAALLLETLKYFEEEAKNEYENNKNKSENEKSGKAQFQYLDMISAVCARFDHENVTFNKEDEAGKTEIMGIVNQLKDAGKEIDESFANNKVEDELKRQEDAQEKKSQRTWFDTAKTVAAAITAVSAAVGAAVGVGALAAKSGLIPYIIGASAFAARKNFYTPSHSPSLTGSLVAGGFLGFISSLPSVAAYTAQQTQKNAANIFESALSKIDPAIKNINLDQSEVEEITRANPKIMEKLLSDQKFVDFVGNCVDIDGAGNSLAVFSKSSDPRVTCSISKDGNIVYSLADGRSVITNVTLSDFEGMNQLQVDRQIGSNSTDPRYSWSRVDSILNQTFPSGQDAQLQVTSNVNGTRQVCCITNRDYIEGDGGPFIGFLGSPGGIAASSVFGLVIGSLLFSCISKCRSSARGASQVNVGAGEIQM